MTIKDIAKSAAALVQADDIEAMLDASPTDPDVKTLVKCVNTAVAELSTTFPVLATEKLAAVDKVIGIGAFGSTPVVVRAVRSGGAAVRFTFDGDGVKVARDGEYEVTYTPVFADCGMTDTPVFGAGADGNIAAILAARNYCIVTGRTDEAQIFDGMYDGECARRRLTRRARIRGRVWG